MSECQILFHNKLMKTQKIIVQQTKPLFWPFVWIFLFAPIGIIWTAWRLHENSKITGNRIARNIFLIIVFGLIILGFVSYIINSPNITTNQIKSNKELIDLANG